jgi:hypothetical protein
MKPTFVFPALPCVLTFCALTGILPLAPEGLAAASETAAKPAEAAPAEITPEAAELFEKHIRPLFVERCQKCHGPEKQESGLRLDNRAGLLKGGESGPIVISGKPEASPLIEAVLYTDDPKMPPDAKLPPQAIAHLMQWVKIGAPWPAADEAPSDVNRAKAAAPDWHTHWAFQPIVEPPLPVVCLPARSDTTDAASRGAWIKSPVDRFVLARLEQAGLSPSPPAERRTLIRRATFDLTGLPPRPDDVAAFVADGSPDAYPRLIDRLLALPQYGERWGRHWLDVARYSDTSGYAFTAERRFPYAYTYRDWVIRALNEDLPYDQFVVQQLAADCLPPTDDKRQLAALGFLTLGRRFLNNMNDIIDDRIDVVSRGVLGLTVGCARCHDHKYDPIPTADYYSLWGVFASTRDEVLPIEPPSDEFARELAKREGKIEAYLEQELDELIRQFRGRTADYLLAAYESRKDPKLKSFKLVEHFNEIHPSLLNRWRSYLQRLAAKPDSVFGSWFALGELPPEGFADGARQLAARLAAELQETVTQDDKPPKQKQRVNRHVAQALIASPPTNIQEAARLYGTLLLDVEQDWQLALAGAEETNEPPPTALPDADAEELRQVFHGDRTPTNLALAEMRGLLNQGQVQHMAKLQKEVIDLRASADAPVSAMGMVDKPVPETPHVMLRGNPSNRGPHVPRQFLGCLAGDARKPFTQGSGRLEMAQAIVDRTNPLTPRVLVNRVWQHHFGTGLVRTPSDFGMRSDPPTHPELLDYLAARFMDSGWSVKWLHRQIMLSSAYQQASDDRPECRAKDPENRLLWKMSRQRLDWESLRDSLLAAAGTLDLTFGGRSVELTSEPFSHRRTVYGIIDRQNLPGLFRTFDFASPDAHTPVRFTTAVPQQALFLFNSPFVVEQARQLAARGEVSSVTDTDQRIRRLYFLLFGREPNDDELALGRQYLSSPPVAGEPHGQLDPWQRYAQALLLTNEFTYID